MQPSHLRRLSGAVAISLVIAACSSAATPVPTRAPTAAPSAGATTAASPTATPLPGTKTFTVGFTNPGISSAPFLAAIADLNTKGYKIDSPVIQSSELVVQGVASGSFAFGSGANNAVLAAVEQGAQIRVVVTRVNNEWTLYAAKSITSCAGLAGKKLAIHSEGAVSTAMVKNYIATKCKGTVPNYVVIPGSENRLQALLANPSPIDASPLELGDAVTVDLKAADRYSILSNFAADLPNLQANAIYVNLAFARDNPGSVVDLIKAVLEQYRKVDGNAAYLQQISEAQVPNAIVKDTVAAASKKFVDLKMFPVNGGLTTENLTYSAKFFGPAPDGIGATKTVVPLANWTDLTYLNLALAAIGKK